MGLKRDILGGLIFLLSSVGCLSPDEKRAREMWQEYKYVPEQVIRNSIYSCDWRAKGELDIYYRIALCNKFLIDEESLGFPLEEAIIFSLKYHPDMPLKIVNTSGKIWTKKEYADLMTSKGIEDNRIKSTLIAER